MEEQRSFVSACKHFFESGPHGRKVEIPEFRALTHDDKIELREQLIAEGYNVAEIGEILPAA